MFNIERITIIGLGLIGGSFAKSCKAKKIAGHITGYDKDIKNLELAKSLGVIDSFFPNIEDAVRKADLILISIPVVSISDTVKKIISYCKDGAIITDTGSVKLPIMSSIYALKKKNDFSFVGAHPIAGTENSGVESSYASLFEGSVCIITPDEEGCQADTDFVSGIWTKMGCSIITMPPEKHDRIFASVSHLPHVIAYSLVKSIAGVIDKDTIKTYAAGGFKDITRVASSNSAMWRDICRLNKKNILECIECFKQSLLELEETIQEENFNKLEKLFSEAKEIRDTI